MPTPRALIITGRSTFADCYTHSVPTPPDFATDGFAGLVDRVASRFGPGSGTLLLAPDAAGRLGLPDQLPTNGAGKTHPAALAARAAGWTVDEISRWTTLTRGSTTVHVGLVALMDWDGSPYWPFAAYDPQETVDALGAWHRHTGHAWVGDPGHAAHAVLREVARYRRGGRLVEPEWWSKAGPAGDPREAQWSRDMWQRDRAGRYRHGFDLTRAYLSAMSVVEVAPGHLRKTGPIEFNATRAGWWLVDLAPWPHWDKAPAPWGPDPDRDVDGRAREYVWLTTPTVALLAEMVNADTFPGFSVHDSFTAPASRNVFRPLAETLTRAWDTAGVAAGDQTTAADDARVRTALKGAFRMAYGKLRSTQTTVCRPDWAEHIVATTRANLWRKVWAAGQATGRWPAYFSGIDTVWYASDSPDPREAAPAGFRLRDPDDPATDRLGTFTAKGFTDTKGDAA